MKLKGKIGEETKRGFKVRRTEESEEGGMRKIRQDGGSESETRITAGGREEKKRRVRL